MIDLICNNNLKNRHLITSDNQLYFQDKIDESAMTSIYDLIIIQAIGLSLLIIVIIFKIISALTNFQIFLKLNNMKLIFLIPFAVSLIFTNGN